ncbi:hypothetical protein HYW53_02500 [Candidatus Giovannonibacteria bacterium]|nr:hypothetical protein [Candidatus Giovannonibacteria bacterium]
MEVLIWLLVGYGLIILQGVMSARDRYFSKRQIEIWGGNAYSFLQHGGIWSDLIIMTPLVTYLLKKHDFPLLSQSGSLAIIISTAVVLTFGKMYRENGKKFPEAHTHDGKTTGAGILHGIYSVIVLWIFLKFYFGEISPSPTVKELFGVAVLLSIHIPLGIIKFTHKWKLTLTAIWQIGSVWILIWVVTGIRIAQTVGL